MDRPEQSASGRRVRDGGAPPSHDLRSGDVRRQAGAPGAAGADHSDVWPREDLSQEAGAPLQPPGLRLRLLGGFQAIARGQPVPAAAWGRPKAASLVKLLALAPGRRLTRDQVLDLLWPDLEPQAAANNLHQALHHARHAVRPADLPIQVVQLRNGVVAIPVNEAIEVDVEAFERAAAAARGAGDIESHEAAIEWYGGDLLPEDRYEDWAAARREALREEYLRLLLTLARLQADRGAPERAIAALQRLVAHEPLHEEAHATLMRLYAHAGLRHQVVRQWGQLRAALTHGLDARPDEATTRLYRDILAGRLPRAAATVSVSATRKSSPNVVTPALPPRHNLPAPLSSFVGRARELADITTLLAGGVRLLTLTGAGGAGKTRLALEAARSAAPDFPGGAWLVELAALTDPAQTAFAVAAARGLREEPGRTVTDTIATALSGPLTLLILDNCEHLIDSCASFVAMLLAACPSLRVLVTSREPLRLPGERVWRVPAMILPDQASDGSVASLAKSDAALLLIDRIRGRLPAFTATPANVGALATICRRLDGLPLALELAAARIPTLTPGQVAARLDDALGLLVGGSRTAHSRQQTLRATLDWSFNLLAEGERALLPLLAVFPGSWTLAAAGAIASGQTQDEIATLTLLTGLVDQSLVEVHDGGEEARYRLLEPVRQYALARRTNAGLPAGEYERALARHAAYYFAFAEQATERIGGPEKALWLARFEQEHDNLRAALRWSFDNERTELALRAAYALGRFWIARSYLSEGRAWLDELLARPPESSAAWTKALFVAGRLALLQDDYTDARRHFECMLAFAREVGDPEDVAAALTQFGHLATKAGELEEARALFEQGLALRRAIGMGQPLTISLCCLGDVVREQGDLAAAQSFYSEALLRARRLSDAEHIGHALGGLGQLARLRGNVPQARALHEQSLAEWRQVGYSHGVVKALARLGQIAIDQDDLERARSLFAESLRLFEQLGAPVETAGCLAGCATLAVRLGEPEQALRLAGAAHALRTGADAPSTPAPRERPRLPDILGTAWQELGDDSAWSAWTAGAGLTYSAAVTAARQLLG